MRFYLDSSALLKRYILERGTERVEELYLQALNGEASLHLSTWNIGEALGAFSKYRRRGWLGDEEHGAARQAFIMEMTRLIKLGVAELVPVRSSLLAESWPLVERHDIYQADALQITSARSVDADELVTGDRRLAEVSEAEAVKATYLG